MLSIIFIILAAICDSVIDTVTHHFSTSVFKSKNPDFWDPSLSWKNSTMIFGYKIDAWHLFKSAMIVLFTLAIVFSGNFPYSLKWYFQIPIFGIIWVIVFNTFYNKILRRK